MVQNPERRSRAAGIEYEVPEVLGCGVVMVLVVLVETWGGHDTDSYRCRPTQPCAIAAKTRGCRCRRVSWRCCRRADIGVLTDGRV